MSSQTFESLRESFEKIESHLFPDEGLSALLNQTKKN
jgi:hypothetical protein